jgi:hypothetical protein
MNRPALERVEFTSTLLSRSALFRRQVSADAAAVTRNRRTAVLSNRFMLREENATSGLQCRDGLSRNEVRGLNLQQGIYLNVVSGKFHFMHWLGKIE